MHYGSVGRVEAGCGVRLDTLWRVADGLGVYLADLLGEPGSSQATTARQHPDPDNNSRVAEARM